MSRPRKHPKVTVVSKGTYRKRPLLSPTYEVLDRRYQVDTIFRRKVSNNLILGVSYYDIAREWGMWR